MKATPLCLKHLGCFLVVIPMLSRVLAGVEPARPPFRTVDLDIGETQELKLSDNTTAKIKLLGVTETRDSARDAVRRAEVKVDINGVVTNFVSATYHLPVTVGGVQLDCPITKGYYTNRDRWEDSWGLDKDARLRLWPAGSPWLVPGTFVYPARQRWFATSTQMGNEPSYVDGGESPARREIYYHSGLDIGGCEGMVDVVSASDGLVVSAGGKALPEFTEAPYYKPQGDYDYVYVLDAHEWYYRYAHLKSIDPAVRPGEHVRMGQKIGVLGKEGSSGGLGAFAFRYQVQATIRQMGDP